MNSDDWTSFAPLPKIDPDNYQIFEARNDYLSGEHDKILKSFRPGNEFLENTNVNEIIKRGNQKPSVREIHRVSYIVQKINEEAVLVPKRLFELDFGDRLALIPSLQINLGSVGRLESYAHFKKPSQPHLHAFLGKLISNARQRSETGLLGRCLLRSSQVFDYQ